MRAAELVFKAAITYLTRAQPIIDSDPFKILVHNIIIQKAGQSRLWTTGMGKAGLVAHKLAATLSSNSIPAAYIHAGEALHGDFGAIRPQDILVAFSNSGKTSEVIQVVRKAKEVGTFVALITGDSDSELARLSDAFLCYGKLKEACSLGLTPTTSIVVMMTIADAIAMDVQQLSGISYREYYRNHHSGYLGQVAKEKSDGT